MAEEKLCVQAIEEHHLKLEVLPHVVGLGVVARKEDDDPGSDDCAVGIYVEKMPTRREARKIPKLLQIREGKRKRRVPVRLIEQGKVELESLSFSGDDEVLGKEPL